MQTNTPENFRKLQEEQLDLFTRKNHDYGNSFEKAIEEDGLIVAKIRLGDKFNRICSLLKSEASVKDESIKDTLMDLSTYALMTILTLKDE